MNEPTVRVVFLLQILSLATYLTAPTPIFFSFLAIDVLLLLLCSPKFRAHRNAFIKLIVVWVFFLSIVGAGRAIGGMSVQAVWRESLDRLEFFSIVAFVASLAYLYIKPEEYLRIFDRLKIPRELSYVFLSVISLVDFVRQTGQRQLHLLTLKGLGPKGIGQRVRSYYRILGPLFSVLLSRQVVHSRSMFYRGFFDSRLKSNSTIENLKAMEIRWLVMFTLNFVSCLLFSLWLSK